MGSVTILDKSEVLSGLFGTWDSIDQLLAGLSEQQWQTPTPLPGWCVHDVVAHRRAGAHGVNPPRWAAGPTGGRRTHETAGVEYRRDAEVGSRVVSI